MLGRVQYPRAIIRINRSEDMKYRNRGVEVILSTRRVSDLARYYIRQARVTRTLNCNVFACVGLTTLTIMIVVLIRILYGPN